MEQQGITIADLYEGNANIEVKFKEHDAPFGVELTSKELNVGTMDFESKPDCKVGSWTANKWFRTDKGASYKKYGKIADLKREITKAAKRRGLTVESYSLKTEEKELA